MGGPGKATIVTAGHCIYCTTIKLLSSTDFSFWRTVIGDHLNAYSPSGVGVFVLPI